jgi:hypothetical protein
MQQLRQVISKVNEENLTHVAVYMIEEVENAILDLIQQNGIPKDNSSPLYGEDYYVVEDKVKEFLLDKVVKDRCLTSKKFIYDRS